MRTTPGRLLASLALTLLLTARAIAQTESPSAAEPQLNEVRASAVSGDLNSIHALCYRYKYGREAKQDYTEAMHWCALAAERGADSSQVLLAEMYYNGQGVEKDPVQAVRWYLKAADQGHPHALLMLYFIYYKGVGVEANQELALAYLQQAAALDYKVAIDELARINAERAGTVQ